MMGKTLQGETNDAELEKAANPGKNGLYGRMHNYHAVAYFLPAAMDVNFAYAVNDRIDPEHMQPFPRNRVAIAAY